MEELFEVGELFEEALIPIAIGCMLLLVVCACIACFALVAGGDLLDLREEGTVPDRPDSAVSTGLSGKLPLGEGYRFVEVTLTISGGDDGRSV